MKQTFKLCTTIILLIVLLVYLSWQSSLVAGGIQTSFSTPEPVEETVEITPLTLRTWHEPYLVLKTLPEPIEVVNVEEEIEPEIAVEEVELAAPVIEETIVSVDTTEYPAAEQIWNYLTSLGWNDYVCAGIMGNLMSEVGGQTLNIQYNLYSSSGGYYGMCQWSKKYHSGIYGINDLEAQCDYLRDTIKYEIDTFGFKYQNNFYFDDFLNLTDAQQAALAFAKCYERCASGSYEVRQRNAIKAYNYFVN